MVEINSIAQKVLCPRPESSKFRGEVLYTEPQLRQFGLIIEGIERKIKFIRILENGNVSTAHVVSEVIKLENGEFETRIHPTHPSLIKRVSGEVVSSSDDPSPML